MLLGKRTRQPIKRTTSMTAINVVDQHPILLSDPQNNPSRAMVSPRNPASGGSAFTNHVVHGATTAAPFLRSCWLCNRRLAPGRDVYMYRGDTAFCSLECREKQMKKDERKEKKNINATASKKQDPMVAASTLKKVD